ncbi:MAG: ADP-heptose-LPS heptosyltransferase [Pseudomonadota bacterium]
MVMAQSLFMTLKAADPAVEIDVLAPGWSLPILERMPEVRRGIAMPLGHGEFGLGKRWQLGRSLARERYGQAIVLPGSLKSALVPWFAGIPRRTGFRGEMRFVLLNDIRALDKQRLPMTVQRFVALGLGADAAQPPATPAPRLRADPANFARLREQFGLAADRPALAFMPGAEYGPAKQWPLRHYGELARLLVARGHQVWVLGSGKDQAAGDEIAALAGPGVHNLCGRTQLADAVDLLDAAVAAVSNDSGLMHVAAALDKPLVGIYGSSTPHHTPPLSDKATSLYLGLECSPCFKRTCPLGHTRCLTEILPQQVLARLHGVAGLSLGA